MKIKLEITATLLVNSEGLLITNVTFGTEYQGLYLCSFIIYLGTMPTFFIKKLPYINNSEENIKRIAKNEENYISFSKELFVDEYSNKKVKLNL